MPISVNLTYRANLTQPLTWAQGDANFKTLADNDVFLNTAVEAAALAASQANANANGRQPSSPKLTAIASSVWAANQMILTTGLNTLSMIPVNNYGLTFLNFDSPSTAKNSLGLQNVDNTSDLNKPVSTATQQELDLKISTSQRGVANGVAALGADGKLPPSQLPPLAVNETFIVNSQSEMLALVAERGDMAFRTDQSNTPYVLTTDVPSVLSNWKSLDKTLSDSLAALNVLTPATDRIPFFTGALTAGLLAVSAVGKALIAAVDKAAGRAAIDAAKSGSNSDITELTGLTSPIPIAQGGVSSGYIEGLIPIWNSSSSVTLSPGAAWIPGSSKNIVVGSAITLSGLNLTANSWYYLYLYDNSGTPAIELVTTAPNAPYSGFSRTKSGTGGNTRRFIAALKTGSSGLFAFLWMGDTIQYMESFSDSPFRVVLSAPASTPTNSDLSPAVPMTTQIALTITTANAGSGAYDIYFSTPERQPKVLQVASGYTVPLRTPMRLACSPSQQITRWVSGGSLTLDVYGYGNER